MNALLERAQARLIDDWRSALSLATVRLHVVVLALLTVYELVPAIPPELQALLPAGWVKPVLAIYAVAGILLRLVKQKTNG